MAVLTHRTSAYHPELGAKLFEAGEEIPAGWYDSPAAAQEVADTLAADVVALRKELLELGGRIDMRWGPRRLQEEIDRLLAEV